MRLYKRGIIKAHTDFNKIGTKFTPFENATDIVTEGTSPIIDMPTQPVRKS